MQNKKIYILLPDGIGLRNFAFTEFHKIARDNGNDLVFWNNTPFDLSSQDLLQIPVPAPKHHFLTEVYKNARKHIELTLNRKKSCDNVYDSYRFPYSYKNSKSAMKSVITQVIVWLYGSENGLKTVRRRIASFEKQTHYYKKCLEQLKENRPDIVFCTNQRPMSAIAPILAAQELGIPTATFIFSWDNLPKATMVIETDHYFVWSDHMKNELLHYYPYINPQQILVTGTPQFEPHYDESIRLSRKVFLEMYQLDQANRYICFSGDDITTSPNDPLYLQDVAKAIRSLNENGHNLGIIFRRCPVDFSDRYDAVLQEYSDVISPVNPKWIKVGDGWNTIMPTRDDLTLQINTIAHTEMVINLGSSMVFDYVAFAKPCAYINYDIPNSNCQPLAKIYNYIHFRSMPTSDAVIWLNAPDELELKIETALSDNKNIIKEAQRWFEIINAHPADGASTRILEGIEKILTESV